MGSVVKNPIGTIGRGLAAGVTGGLSEFAQKNPFGAPVNNPINKMLPINNDYLKTGAIFSKDNPNPYVSGPFTLDPYQLAADQTAISGLGASQDEQNKKFINEDATSRESSRQALAKALTTQGQEVFRQGLPDIEEKLNSQHLLNGSGLGQEIGRQQEYLANNVANEVGKQGALDLNRSSDQRAQALQSLQGFGQAGLGRQLSMEDFINQANVAKTIGAQTAPQVGNGKGVGTGLAGAGLGLKAGSMFGPAGGLAGAGIGGLLAGKG